MFWGEITVYWLLKLSTLIIKDQSIMGVQESQSSIEKVSYSSID